MLLDDERIDVWVHRVAPTTFDYFGDGLKFLDNSEKLKAARFRFRRDQYIYVATRVFVRHLLSKYHPQSPDAWKFTTNEFGKPSLAAGMPLTQHLQFNLSHSQGLVAVAIGKTYSLGLDVERSSANLSACFDDRSILSEEERLRLEALPAEEKDAFFLKIWTLKEAFGKARGHGLHFPLSNVCFRFDPPGRVRVLTQGTMPTDGYLSWRFWQFAMFDDFSLALCAGTGVRGKQNVVVKESNLFADVELPVACELIAASQ